ncbi:hypothetical protein DFH09DRAFT_1301114 [Mycena vulgaris]|nr:hypothetical protein DFH09DRAFT_1301114 [Mycena vulgaris]
MEQPPLEVVLSRENAARRGPPTLAPAVARAPVQQPSENEFALLTRALRALLHGVGPLLVLESFASPEIEFRDGAGHTRHVWEHLSQHYDLYKTVREIRIQTAYWEEYIESFATYPPQAPDGITLALSGGTAE